MAAEARRPGGNRGKKGPAVGTGGHGRKALEGKGPTPKAEDREYHPAHKRKQAADSLKGNFSDRKKVVETLREPLKTPFGTITFDKASEKWVVDSFVE